MTAESDISTPHPPDCQAFAQTVQAVLDGDLPADALSDGHGSICPTCRQHAAAAAALLAGFQREPGPIASPKFADRVVWAALRERRVRTFRRRAAGGLAIAAGLMAAVVLTRPTIPPSPQSDGRDLVASAVPPIRASEQLSEARSALASLSSRTADEAIAPTRTLFASLEAPPLPAGLDVPTEVEPAVASLAGMPQAAWAGFAPLANSTRRAVNLFLRDTGLGDTVSRTY